MISKFSHILPAFNVVLASCSFIPSTGPFASNMMPSDKTPINIIDVNDILAKDLLEKELGEDRAQEEALIKRLSKTSGEKIVLSRGDIVKLILWVTEGHADPVLGNAPRPKEMGNFTIDTNGYLSVPYIKPIFVAGSSLSRASATVSKAFSDIGLFPKLEATMQMVFDKQQNVVIMGAVNLARAINWPEGGMKFSEAIAQAGGVKVFDFSNEGKEFSVNYVDLYRRARVHNLTMSAALKSDFPLHPGDRIVLKHVPLVQVSCLGAGWRTPSIVAFDEKPFLSEVLAKAGDLDRNSAQGRAIFILKRLNGNIYKVDMSKVDGLLSAQNFPIDDRDVIYVPPARIVPLQQIVNTLTSAGYPAAVAASAR